MKALQFLFVVLLTIAQVVADPNTNPPTYIKGTLDIKYNSRAKPNTIGELDIYFLNVNISNSARFVGAITNTPLVKGRLYGDAQLSSLEYDLKGFIINPNWKPTSPPNVLREKQISKIYGKVPISQEGVYNYDAGTIKIGGTLAGAGESPFKGLVQGKALYRPKGWFESLQQEAINITRSVGGEAKALPIVKWEKMRFQQHVIGAGPSGIYPEVTVNGDMIYDYNRGVWFFENLLLSYNHNEQQYAQKLTGNVRWVEQPAKGNLRLGEYQFDIRVNEKALNEAAMFSASTVTEADEASFFEENESLRYLGGVMKYKDTMNGKSPVASNIEIDLIGNKLSKQEGMNIFKLVFFTCIIPFNSE